MNETPTFLIDQLYHPDKNVRSAAVLELGTLGTEAALTALIEVMCREADVYVREDITWALVRIGEAALPRLLALLLDESALVRQLAAHTLSKLRDARAVPALIESLHDSDEAVVTKAAFALGQIGALEALPTLVTLLKHENRDLQNTLMFVLETFGTASLPALIEALNDVRPLVREHAADTLGFLGHREAEAALITRLSDPEGSVRFAVVNALSSLGGQAVRQALIEMPSDPEARVRDLAAHFLKTMR